MILIDYEHRFSQLPDYKADAVVGDTAFEVLTTPRDVQKFRNTLMQMARLVATHCAHRAIVVLDEPHITEPRLKQEWADAAAIFRPELFKRLSIAIRQPDGWSGIPASPDPQDVPVLDEIVAHTRTRQRASAGRGADSYFEILRILIHEWLLGKGATPIHTLMEMAGSSHPTVSKALERLSYCVRRRSDRSVELRHFPREEWAKLVAVADDVRSTARFVDRSGQPRSPESLLRRLTRLKRDDIGVGGVWGSKHYHPALDLVGNPRLDLTVHTAGKIADLSFVKRLDPALEQTTARDEAPVLVVHTLRRAASLFQRGDGDLNWADPVECLLDLHEARLEPQAWEFLHAFPATKSLNA